MRSLMKDIVTVLHEDGSKHENVRASVQKGQIFINDVTIPLSIGDRIERELPSGQREVLLVTDFQVWKGNGGIRDFYEIDYRREGVQQHQLQPSSVNLQVSHSPQARVNLYSSDRSQNTISSQPEQLFSQLRDLLREFAADSPDLEVLLELVDDMERSRATGDFTRAYRDFVAAAADHISILVPVLPALTSLL